VTAEEFEATVLKAHDQLLHSAAKRLREHGVNAETARQEAPDIVQATYLDLLAFAPSFQVRSERETMAWVYTSLKRRVADYCRARARRPLPFGDDLQELKDEHAWSRHDHELPVMKVLFWVDVARGMSPKLFQVVDAVFRRGFEWHEVGAALGYPWRTLQSQWRRAQLQLQERLRPYFHARESAACREKQAGGGGWLVGTSPSSYSSDRRSASGGCTGAPVEVAG
jgi:DNA-directed RNA polymerase specialized sigma24 family protein